MVAVAGAPIANMDWIPRREEAYVERKLVSVWLECECPSGRWCRLCFCSFVLCLSIYGGETINDCEN